LAIDGDSNPNLGITLGIPAEQLNHIEALPGDLLQDIEDEDGNRQTVLRSSVEEIAAAYGTNASDGVKLLAMKKIDHAGKG
jgi:CO dehydrogenase nickel-insertion accessory protein CooC1